MPPVSWRRDRKARIAAAALGAIAIVFALWSLGRFAVHAVAEGNPQGLGPTLMVVTVAAGTLLNLRGRLLARTAEEVLADDTRPPVLYFRPFRSDEQRVVNVANDAFERTLRDALGGIGPLIAIGNPGDHLPPLGAARFYVSPGSDWRTDVEHLLSHAQLVVLRAAPDPGDGMRWELQRIIAAFDLQRFLLALPRGTRRDRRPGRAYTRFWEQTVDLFPHPLPVRCHGAPFLAFDAAWKPRCLGPGDSMLALVDADYRVTRTLKLWAAAAAAGTTPQ